MRFWINRFVLLTAVIVVPLSASAAESVTTDPARVRKALDRLEHDTEGFVVSTINPSTGTPRLLRIPSGALHLEGATPKAKTMAVTMRLSSQGRRPLMMM